MWHMLILMSHTPINDRLFHEYDIYMLCVCIRDIYVVHMHMRPTCCVYAYRTYMFCISIPDLYAARMHTRSICCAYTYEIYTLCVYILYLHVHLWIFGYSKILKQVRCCSTLDVPLKIKTSTTQVQIFHITCRINNL